MLRRFLCLLLAAFFVMGPSVAHAGFELQPMVGYSWVNMTGLSEDQFLEAAPTAEDIADADGDIDVEAQIDSMLEAAQVPVKGDGLSVGVGAQLSLLFFVVGARYAYTNASDFGLHTVGADLGLRLGAIVSLYGRAGAGFAMVSDLPDGLSANGFYADVGMGLEIMPPGPISFGFGIDGNLLFLGSTSQLESAADAVGNGISADTISEADGTAVGYQLRPQVHVIWHL